MDGDCIILVGVIGSASYKLRPMVSINLKTSGYTLEKIEKDGNISFKLVK